MKKAISQIDISHVSLAFLIGIGTGGALISFLVFNVSHPKPEWGEYWRIKPLILTPISAGLGAVAGYALSRVAMFYGLNKWFGFFLAFCSFFVSLWLGIVLGCNGTLWN